MAAEQTELNCDLYCSASVAGCMLYLVRYPMSSYRTEWVPRKLYCDGEKDDKLGCLPLPYRSHTLLMF